MKNDAPKRENVQPDTERESAARASRSSSLGPKLDTSNRLNTSNDGSDGETTITHGSGMKQANGPDAPELYAGTLPITAPLAGLHPQSDTTLTATPSTTNRQTSPSSADDATCSMTDGSTPSLSWHESISQRLYETAGVRPYYSDDRCLIIHGDCREILPTLEPGSVDLVLTDPPYGVEYVTARRSRTDPLVAPIAGDESLNTLADAMPHVDRILGDNRHAYFFASPFKIGDTAAIVSDFLKVKNIIVWDKGDAGSVGDLEAGYGVNWEAIVYASKGRRSLKGPRPRAIYRYDWSGTRDPVHPTVKPVGVLQWLIAKSTEPGDLIVDMFAGSGTTGRAAKDMGRRAILIEQEERYCEVAARRLEQAVLPLAMAD